MKDTYDHKEVESRWQKRWLDEKLDQTNITGGKKPFYNLMMFPYPSAEGLHVGNMYAFTGSDIYGRFKRMQGYEVFEPIGLDGFGIHSENYALKIGRHPMDHAKITEKNFYNQLHTIGAMFDWSRTVETYDPDYYRWTQWIFVQMFKHGLAYRGKASVNWCPKDKTVLADEQVIDGKCERCGNIVEKRLLDQWFFRITAYAEKLLGNLSKLDWSEKIKVAQKNWIGKKEGINIHHKVEGLDLGIYTVSLYPAWLWADTFIVIAPDHPFALKLARGTNQEKFVTDYLEAWAQNKKQTSIKTDEKEGVFTGRYAADPLRGGARMPIWIGNFALMEFGTGMIRCSAHDPRDYAFAEKYHIPLREVVERTNKMEPVNAHTNEGVLQQSGPFSDKNISDHLINQIIDWIVQKGIGERTTTYHLRDWLISRQRYWGPPIPMIFCQHCEKARMGEQKDMPGWWTVPEDQLPVILPRIEDYQPGDDGLSPLAKHKEFYNVACPHCGKPARRETDVSDTFLDSSWYFLRYPSVNVAEVASKNFGPSSESISDLDRHPVGSRVEAGQNFSSSPQQLPWDPVITKKWLPVDMYTGGAEHAVLHLLYSRFVTMALHGFGFLDFEEPFPKFYAHGLLIKEGAKMSKSKGNVINPDQYIALYGADALRLYLMFMGPFDQGGDFRDASMEGMSRWVGRIWRIAMQSIAKLDPLDLFVQSEVKKALPKLVKKVTEDIEKRHYNTAIAAMMEFTNLAQGHAQDQGGSIGREELKTLVLLLAPFAPYLAEELWQKIRAEVATGKRSDATFFGDARLEASLNEVPPPESSAARSASKGAPSGALQNAHPHSLHWSVHLQSWPTYNLAEITEESAQILVQVNGRLRDKLIVSVKQSKDQSAIEAEAAASEKVKKFLSGKSVVKTVFVPGRLINFVM